MQNSFEQPDLELMLRGRPTDLPPIRVQLVVPRNQKRRLPLPNRFACMLKRDRWILAAFAVLGLVGALTPGWLYPRLYEASAALEVLPPADAEIIAKRATERRLLESPALQLQIESLPEFTLGNAWQNRLRRLIGLPPIPAKPSEEDFVTGLRENLRLTLSPTGRMIHMQFCASDPPKAAAYLDLLAGEIMNDQEALRAENTRLAREAYAAQMARARAELQAAEEDLTGYARAAGMLDEQTAASVNSRFLEVQKNVSSARASLPGDSVSAAEAAGLADTLEKTRQHLASIRAEQAIRLDSKKREYDSKRAIYDAVYKKAKEAETEAARSGGVRLLAPAQVAGTASRPILFGRLLLGALAGLAIGILFSLGRGAIGGKLHDAAEIEGLLGVPLLGVIPPATLSRGVLSGRQPHGVIDLNAAPDNNSGPELFRSQPRPAMHTAATMGEAFRHILAGIWIAGQHGKRPRVLLFASPGKGEGKTTLAANVGIALAHTRRRVLIIDANLRRPQLHAIFGVPSNWGLANLLAGSEPVEDYPFEHVVFKTDIAGLYILPAGSGELEISGMRHIDRLTELLLRFRLEFHAVLIDTPGALRYPDARIVARLTDSVVMVLRAGVSSRQQAEILARQFETDGTSVLGAVMNDCKNIS